MLQREDDSYIMDWTSGLKDQEISKINRCRIFLRAWTISDITNAQGTSITKAAFDCLKEGQGTMAHKWPNQPRPGPIHRRIWKKFMQQLCEDKSQELLTPLGKWISKSIRHISGTKYFINTMQPIGVYYQEEEQWFFDRITTGRKYSRINGNPTHTDPQDITRLVPIDIITRNNIEQLVWSEYKGEKITTLTPTQWDEYVCQLEPWRKQLIQHHFLETSINDIMEELKNPEILLLCVSDGSCNPSQNFGTYGWTIYHANRNQTLCSGYGHIPGFPVSSFRAEGFGKLSWLVFINEICRFKKLSRRCKINSYCDNLAIVKRTTIQMNHQNLSHTLAPSYDVLREIYFQQIEMELETNTCHVKGHQDKAKAKDQLSIQEQLNIEVDEIAEKANDYFKKKKNQYTQYYLPNGGPFLQVDKKSIWSGETQVLQWRRSEFILQKYYQDKFKLSEETLRDINWIGFRLARQALTPGLSLFSQKYGIDWLPTGKQMHRRGHLVTECILCGEQETCIHLLLFPNRYNDMLEAMREFEGYLKEINTEPSLQRTLIHQMNNWLVLPNEADELTQPELHKSAIGMQQQIGWHLFVRGYLANGWAQIQDQFLLSIKSPQLGDSWSAKISLWWIKKSHEVWISRNECVHGKQPGLESRLEEEVFAQIQQLYDQAEDLPALDREILDMPIQQRLQQPVRSLKRWLDITKPTVQRCIDAYSAVLLHQNRNMSEFYSWRDVRNRPDKEPINGQQHMIPGSATFIPWRDTTDQTTQNSSQHDRGEATPSSMLTNITNICQESLSSCRK